jgi:Xaa-Pro aminopeptidase
MSTENMPRRIKTIRAQMSTRRIDGLVLTKPADVTYLTGFLGQDSWTIVTRNAVYLLTDSRYTEQAQKECVQTTIVERTGSIAEAAGMLLNRLKSVKITAVERSISLSLYTILRKSLHMPLRAVDDPVDEPRSRKDEDEIAVITTAISIATQAFIRLSHHIEPGITENTLAGLLDLEIRRSGGKSGFEPIVAFGSNASRPHHQPTQRKLGHRDTILIDFGAAYRGYCCDITRSFAFGTPPAAFRRAYEVLARAQSAALGSIRAGAVLEDVDAVAKRIIRESGLPVYGHGSGHGIGLEVHEMPFLKEKAKGKLQAGQIITIEPGIYLPGKFGIRLEDDILITETGCQILTRACPQTPLPT